MSDTSISSRPSIGARLRAVPFRLWVALAIITLALLFVLQNRASTSIHILNMAFTAPLWLVLVLCVLAGASIAALLRRRNTKR